jgi:hypothetical protein
MRSNGNSTRALLAAASGKCFLREEVAGVSFVKRAGGESAVRGRGSQYPARVVRHRGVNSPAEKPGINLVTVFFALSEIATWKIRIELFRYNLSFDINGLRVEVWSFAC